MSYLGTPVGTSNRDIVQARAFCAREDWASLWIMMRNADPDSVLAAYCCAHLELTPGLPVSWIMDTHLEFLQRLAHAIGVDRWSGQRKFTVRLSPELWLDHYGQIAPRLMSAILERDRRWLHRDVTPKRGALRRHLRVDHWPQVAPEPEYDFVDWVPGAEPPRALVDYVRLVVTVEERVCLLRDCGNVAPRAREAG